MRHSGLSLAVFLLLSAVIWAQHGSGGGGGGGSSSASSGGGSHGGGGGGSGYSGGGHSSGGGHASGTTSTTPSSHARGSTLASSNSIESYRFGSRGPTSSLRHSPQELNLAPQLKPVPPEKHSFFSFVRHPFHRPNPNRAQINPVRPICFRGLCGVCPARQARAGGCSAPVIPVQPSYGCSYRGSWNGRCLGQAQLFAGCGGLRFSLEQQLHRLESAESQMQNNCRGGASQECSQTTATRNSEANLYRALQARYRSCMSTTSFMGSPYGGYMISRHGSGLVLEPFGLGLDD